MGGEKESELWSALKDDAASYFRGDSRFTPFLEKRISRHDDYRRALAGLLTEIMKSHADVDMDIASLVDEPIMSCSELVSDSIDDLFAAFERDPASRHVLEIFLFYRGFQALQAHRLAHYYWSQGRRSIARYIQSISVKCFSMDLHPGARIAGAVFIDHGTGIVVGETSRIDRNVSILHNVTLGGTGKSHGDRHPKICEGVLLGAGCKILGNITVGRNSKIAAGSVVLKDVPEAVTVAGIPGKVIGLKRSTVPAYDMDAYFDFQI
jgi:serine O-acetyltransferase